MITYGHEKYIVQAVESIMMQQCEFDFELIISNDHSPDSTDYVIKKIIDEHPNSYKIKYHLQKNNIGMIPNFIFALNQAKSRYIALCDGDDYWTDPLKLQKQVDFLEANEDYSICWTKYLIQSITMLNTPDWEIELSAKLPLTIDLNTIFSPYCTYTLTTVFRNNALDCESFSNLKYSKDNTIYAICLTKGKGVLLNFYGGNYRLHEKSTYSSTSLFEQYYFSYLNIHEIISNIKQCNFQHCRQA